MSVLDLSPFRVLVNVNILLLDWYMDYQWEGPWARIETPNAAERDAWYDDKMATYGGLARWLVRKGEFIVDGSTVYWASLDAILLHTQIIGDQPPDWTPPPYTDPFYKRYFEQGETFTIQYPDPHADTFLNWKELDIWNAGGFKINNVERRKSA